MDKAFPFCLLSALLLSLPVSAANYRDPARHFSFDYDQAGWEIVPQPSSAKNTADVDQAMASHTLVTVQHKAADDKYRSRFSVVVDELKHPTGSPIEDLAAYQKKAVDFMKSQRFDILSTNAVTLPGVTAPAFEIVANQRDFGLTFRQVVFLRDRQAYLLTEASRTGKFEAYQKQTRQFYETFHFEGK